MTTFAITHRHTGSILYSGGGETLRDVVVSAVKGGADLRSADLGGADLRGAYLRGAKLIGDRPILQIGPIGSRSDYLIACVTDQGVLVRAGCFFGSLDELSAAIDKTHGDSVHGIEYATAIAMIDAHAELWTPAAIEQREAA